MSVRRSELLSCFPHRSICFMVALSVVGTNAPGRHIFHLGMTLKLGYPIMPGTASHHHTCNLLPNIAVSLEPPPVCELVVYLPAVVAPF